MPAQEDAQWCRCQRSGRRDSQRDGRVNASEPVLLPSFPGINTGGDIVVLIVVIGSSPDFATVFFPISWLQDSQGPPISFV